MEAHAAPCLPRCCHNRGLLLYEGRSSSSLPEDRQNNGTTHSSLISITTSFAPSILPPNCDRDKNRTWTGCEVKWLSWKNQGNYEKCDYSYFFCIANLQSTAALAIVPYLRKGRIRYATWDPPFTRCCVFSGMTASCKSPSIGSSKIFSLPRSQGDIASCPGESVTHWLLVFREPCFLCFAEKNHSFHTRDTKNSHSFKTEILFGETKWSESGVTPAGNVIIRKLMCDMWLCDKEWGSFLLLYFITYTLCTVYINIYTMFKYVYIHRYI